MSAGFLDPTLQLSTFALGLAILHVARGRAAALTPALAGGAIILAILVVLVAALEYGPDDGADPDVVTIYGAA